MGAAATAQALVAGGFAYATRLRPALATQSAQDFRPFAPPGVNCMLEVEKGGSR